MPEPGLARAIQGSAGIRQHPYARPRDPRLRLAVALVLAFGFSAVTAAHSLPLLVTLTLLAVAASGIGLRDLWRRLRAPGAVMVGILLALPLIAGTTPVATLGPVTVRAEGLAAALLIAARLAAIVAVVVAFLAPVPLLRLIAALRALGVPGPMADLALLLLRYLDEVRAELGRMRLALALRGGRLTLRHLPHLGWLLAALLLRSHARAERLWQAMRARGYGAVGPEPMPPVGRADWLALAAAVAAVLGLLALDRLA